MYQATMADVKNCRWLDFFDDLMCVSSTMLPSVSNGATGKSLNPLYEMDGTHLSPAYVKLLQKALVAAGL